MKNWLVIHNDNIPNALLKEFKEKQNILKFDITPALQMNENFSFDNEATEILESHFLNEKTYDCIFIPYNLNKELYLDFSGLKIALHIRLSHRLSHTFCPIVFYGNEDPLHVAKLSPHSNILFSIGTLTSNKISYEDFNLTSNHLKEMAFEDYANFLKELNLNPSVNYKSHHSVANEFALFQWSTFIGCDDQIDEVKVNLKTRLYFKYLEALRLFDTDVGWTFGIDQRDPGFPNISIDGKINEGKDKDGKEKYQLAKVLLIDDEAKKGWDSFYDNLFKLNPDENSRVDFDSLRLVNLERKEVECKTFLDRMPIIEQAQKKVKEFDPDIVLLDLRLHDDDFKQGVSPDDLTGIQILRRIEKINRGIQVIITSASNKIWNYEASEKTGLGVDGYIIKSDDENPEESVKKICKKVNDLIPKAVFLKAVEEKMASIKQLFPEKESEDYIKNNSFYISSLTNLDVAFKLFNDSKINKKYNAFGFLQLFMILEDFVKREDICWDYSKKFVVKNGNTEVIVVKRDDKRSYIKTENIMRGDLRFKNIYTIGEATFDHWIDTNIRVSSVLIFRNGLPNADQYKWPELRNLRNDIAHGNDEIKSEYILYILNFLLFVLNNDNLKETNIDKGFKKKSESDKLNDLQNKFKKH